MWTSYGPLVLKEKVVRWSIAVSVCVWAVLVRAFKRGRWPMGGACAGTSVYIAVRAVAFKNPKYDVLTWKPWTLWMAGVYLVPLTGMGS